MSILDQLKKINPLNLDLHLKDSWLLSYEEGIELTHYYVRKLINVIPTDETLKNRWLILNDKYRDAYLSNTRIHIFKTHTGSGKTVTSVLWVKFLSQLSSKIEGFVVLSPEYENGTDEIERIIVKYGNQVHYVRFEGKNRLCTQQNTKINKRGINIGMLMRNGISIKPFCENMCPQLKTCEYKCNCALVIAPIEKGGIKNWIGVQHQIGYFLPIFMYHVGDIILVIDENFANAIKEHHRYGIGILNDNIKFLNIALKELRSNNDENYKFFIEEFKRLLLNFRQSLFTYLTELDYNKIADILDNIDDSKGTDNNYAEKLNEQAFKYVKNGKMAPFKFIFSELCNFIDNYEELLNSNYDDIENWLKASFYKKQNKYEITFLYYDKCKLGALFNRDNLLKLIINDATANKVELSYLIGDKEPVLEHNEDWMYENCEFHQLNKRINSKKDRQYAYYPKSSFMYEKTFFYLIGDLKAILERHKNEKVLVVAREIDGKYLKFNGGIKLSDYIYTLGYSNVIFEDYPLSATNEYSDVNVVVILGKPELPTAVIKRQATLIGMEQDVYREIFSKTSIVQAIGRIMRGNKHKYIYFITGFDLKLNRPIKSYKSHTELRNSLQTETNIIENKKIEKLRYNIILNHIKKNKFITIKDCENLFKFSNYKSSETLKNFEKQGKLKSKKVERGKIVFYI